MDTFSLKTAARTDFGGKQASQLRTSGRYPATLVGSGQPTVQFSVDAAEFDGAVRISARSYDLALDGGAEKAAIQEVQFDPMGDKIMQIDFIRDADGALAVARATHFGDKGYESDDE
ncbi:MAG: hypothetical protein COA70_11010 [Planctomycetota bacterium]|nr:MAG: hypothetical protein COA70_11010 [Planctomycetota bacterium]